MKNFLKNKKAQLVALTTIAASAAIASTAAPSNSDDFLSFYTKIDQWSSSGLAVGLSLASLIIGGGMGVAKASPMPALGGIGLAAFFAFGPGVIKSLILGGSVLA